MPKFVMVLLAVVAAAVGHFLINRLSSNSHDR
jgi:hypothetical protein